MANKPAVSKDTIYVDAEDDITAIIDKIEGAKNKVVALVLPKRTAALQSIVNMRLLKRSAENAGKSVVLITGDNALMPLAGAAGMHVAKNLQSKPEIPAPPDETPKTPATDETGDDSQKLNANLPIGALALAHDSQEAIDLEDGDEEPDEKPKKSKPAKDKKLKVPNFDRFRALIMAAIVAGIALLVFLIMGLFVWPKANITINTESTPVSSTFNINATDKAKALDEAASVIPATSKTSDQTGTAQQNATGQQNNGTKATGSVTLTNCTDSPATIPAGTGISTNGLTYITQSTVSLHQGNFTSGGVCQSSGNHVGTTSITAQQGGSKYNTSLNGASVSGSSGISASGSAAGGTDNNITVVSQADVDAAKQKAISPQSASDFTKNFVTQLESQGFYVISSTMKAGDAQVTATPGVGQPASSTNVSVKITYSVLAVQKSDLAKVISDQLNKQIDTKKQKISNSDVVKDATVTVQSSGSPSQATLQVSISTTAIPTIDTLTIQKKAGGMKKGDIQKFISDYPGVKSVDVKLSPFWVSKAPKKPAKVHVILIQTKTNS